MGDDQGSLKVEVKTYLMAQRSSPPNYFSVNLRILGRLEKWQVITKPAKLWATPNKSIRYIFQR